MNFISVCAGIEAASEAWNPLGWKACLLSEIEAAPRAVLKYRHSAVDVRQTKIFQGFVPLWGDFTALRVRHLRRLGIPIPDVLVGGTPCQSFSIAGLRKSLADDRGNLTFAFVRLADAIDNVRRRDGKSGLIVLWENVPGIFSTKDNAFGCFLAGLVGADAPLVPGKGQRWTRAGMVAGPRRRAAWVIKDAQFFGLAQRRERVFVVASPLDGPDPSEILFEPEGVRRHSSPIRETRERPAPTISARPTGGGGLGTDFDLDGGLIAHSLRAQASHRADTETYIAIPILEAGARTGKSTDDVRAGSGIGDPGDPMFTLQSGKQHAVAFGGNNTSGPVEVAAALAAHGGPHGRMDFASETFITGTLNANGTAAGSATQQDAESGMLVTHSLRAEGFDASEDGTGRGTPLGPVAPPAFDTRQSDVIQYGDHAGPLDTDGYSQAIAFTAKDHGADASCDLSPTMRAMGHSESHANGGGQLAVAYGFEERCRGDDGRGYDRAPHFSADVAPSCNTVKPPAVAFNLRGREGGSVPEAAEAAEAASLRASSGGSSRSYIATSQVRRLMPPECEILQGFRPGYTLVPFRNGWMADGPRYKMLGNSMAIPCMAWIGRRIVFVMDRLTKRSHLDSEGAR